MDGFEAAGVQVKLHINGTLEHSVAFFVQPFMTTEAFLTSASQKLNLSSVAIKA